MIESEPGRAEVLRSAGGTHGEKGKSINLGVPSHLDGSAVRERERLSVVYSI
jgi:hypothetical protein